MKKLMHIFAPENLNDSGIHSFPATDMFSTYEKISDYMYHKNDQDHPFFTKCNYIGSKRDETLAVRIIDIEFLKTCPTYMMIRLAKQQLVKWEDIEECFSKIELEDNTTSRGLSSMGF